MASCKKSSRIISSGLGTAGKNSSLGQISSKIPLACRLMEQNKINQTRGQLLGLFVKPLMATTPLHCEGSCNRLACHSGGGESETKGGERGWGESKERLGIGQ